MVFFSRVFHEFQDTKLALMMTSNMLHERFHRSTGIAFSSIYPGSLDGGRSDFPQVS